MRAVGEGGAAVEEGTARGRGSEGQGGAGTALGHSGHRPARPGAEMLNCRLFDASISSDAEFLAGPRGNLSVLSLATSLPSIHGASRARLWSGRSGETDNGSGWLAGRSVKIGLSISQRPSNLGPLNALRHRTVVISDRRL